MSKRKRSKSITGSIFIPLSAPFSVLFLRKQARTDPNATARGDLDVQNLLKKKDKKSDHEMTCG
jgi:hypothetical protein